MSALSKESRKEAQTFVPAITLPGGYRFESSGKLGSSREPRLFLGFPSAPAPELPENLAEADPLVVQGRALLVRNLAMWLCRWLVELALWLLCGFIVLPLQDADRMKAPATMNTLLHGPAVCCQLVMGQEVAVGLDAKPPIRLPLVHPAEAFREALCWELAAQSCQGMWEISKQAVKVTAKLLDPAAGLDQTVYDWWLLVEAAASSQLPWLLSRLQHLPPLPFDEAERASAGKLKDARDDEDMLYSEEDEYGDEFDEEEGDYMELDGPPPEVLDGWEKDEMAMALLANFQSEEFEGKKVMSFRDVAMLLEVLGLEREQFVAIFTGQGGMEDEFDDDFLDEEEEMMLKAVVAEEAEAEEAEEAGAEDGKEAEAVEAAVEDVVEADDPERPSSAAPPLCTAKGAEFPPEALGARQRVIEKRRRCLSTKLSFRALAQIETERDEGSLGVTLDVDAKSLSERCLEPMLEAAGEKSATKLLLAWLFDALGSSLMLPYLGQVIARQHAEMPNLRLSEACRWVAMASYFIATKGLARYSETMAQQTADAKSELLRQIYKGLLVDAKDGRPFSMNIFWPTGGQLTPHALEKKAFKKKVKSVPLLTPDGSFPEEFEFVVGG
ncbi:hypothetical protein AK812_SmicGene28490 [Symbiodinium microadriaticum]|uniref:Uncharacterized protein n=1 Tax=Symbiodinium microadriaticum TaxID=2951 RepID=A0A1Q9D483_SYMMI|nr:hypothetical protein AK812_SmicGene28490 [Symbiodinium microadriaticum]